MVNQSRLSVLGGAANQALFVKMLDQELQAAEDIEAFVFTFDAWAHRGDPLRRSFLEALMQALLDESPGSAWVSKDTCGSLMENIRGQRELVESETKPKLTIWGYLAALWLLLVPYIGGVLDKALEDGLCSRAFWVLIALSLPGVFLGAMVVWQGFLGKYLRKGAERDDGEGEEGAAVLFNRVKETTKVRATRTPGPTSIEFHRVFTTIVAEALESKGATKGPNGSGSKRRLVIVIDNLDRVDTDEAKAIWSTMRTFFEFGGDKPEWLERLWLVVPFAPSTPERLWNAETSPESWEDETRAQAFVNKTFQVRFDVPAPILSDWRLFLTKLFLTKKLKQAFPRHFKKLSDEIHSICYIYQATLRRKADDRSQEPG